MIITEFGPDFCHSMNLIMFGNLLLVRTKFVQIILSLNYLQNSCSVSVILSRILLFKNYMSFGPEFCIIPEFCPEFCCSVNTRSDL